ncbi:MULTISPECIES: peptide MFS transporter [unclassified Aureispira]|uniref:peptide MFS transporter n=1 Tax=unclassified Aureispira TaxID=2649989 RepID=UPI000697A688|nr:MULTISPECIES: peptide MFS transporter [unclassified Aureispira]WMX14322.1 peptide MFS transporter [Aureispira sp. CCB-E]
MGTYTTMALAWVFCAIWIVFVISTNRKVHPKVLFFLFFVEMWERFSYYGMRALLVLYMTSEVMNYSTSDAYGIYGAYGALVYATPLIGGLLAEKFMGYRKAIMWGAFLMMCGHFLMAIENELIFLTALALLIMGNGFFKPNISSMIGKFYAKTDPRRDGAFTIFYMGINIGAFLSGLTCGAVGLDPNLGWHFGFGLAGVGMLLGLLIFWYAERNGILEDKGYAPYQVTAGGPGIMLDQNNGGEILNNDPTLDNTTKTPTDQSEASDDQVERFTLVENPVEPKLFGLPLNLLIYIGSIIAIPFFLLLIQHNDILDYGIGGIGIIMVTYLLYSSFQYEKVQRQRIWVIVTLFFFTIIFWTFFELAGSALTVFTMNNVRPNDYLNAAMFNSLNPFFIMLFAPIFSWLWVKLSNANMEPAAPVKFGIGLILLGSGFLILNFSKGGAVDGLIAPMFMVFLYLLHTLGELTLSPVGLSMVTKLAPAQVVGFVMGFWLMASSFAHQAGKTIAQFTVVPEGTPAEESLSLCLSVFNNLGLIAVCAGGFLILASVVITKWMHGIK